MEIMPEKSVFGPSSASVQRPDSEGHGVLAPNSVLSNLLSNGDLNGT